MRRLWTVLSVTAVLNLTALGAAVGYAAMQGWLARDRVLAAVAALRGEAAAADPATTQPTRAADRPRPAGERIQEMAEFQERARIELARREREVQDQWQLLEARQLALLQEKERFEEEKKRYAAAVAEQARLAGSSGQQKELEILSGLKAKEAKDLLLQKDDAEVVRMLMGMELRQARKIVSACRTEEERLWIGRVLRKLHEQDAAQAEALGAGS